MATERVLSPVVQRRRLRAELRKARQDAEMTQEQVAAAMDWSLSKVIRIEAGSVSISTNDLKVLLQYYQITDQNTVEMLIALARGARERSWWSGYGDVASPRLLQYVEYEAAATVMRNFQPLVVPGLLQTFEYAKALISQFARDEPVGRVDSLIDLRLRRQELLEQSESRFMFIIDEAVVHRMVGSQDVMRQQLRRLIDVANKPNVSIQMVPFSAGLHPGLAGSHVILEFGDAIDDDVLYLETTQGDIIRQDDQEEVLKYREIYEQLRSRSLGLDESIAYIERVVGELV
jgi:transcriptional regulator with XRE-family HTH domain